jgi:8-oxo-dGTP pyrophosphatase MutT (NUDIX family)
MVAMYSAAEIRTRLVGVVDPGGAFPDRPGERVAAVLVPVITSGDPRIVFTLRTGTLSRHAGEISFPGGLADPGETPAATALRETEEELGLPRDQVEVLGTLGTFHTRALGTLIVPVVGLLASEPEFHPNAAEIERVLVQPVAGLSGLGRESEFTWEGQTFPTYVFDTPGQVIWGATARILRGFLDALESPAVYPG